MKLRFLIITLTIVALISQMTMVSGADYIRAEITSKPEARGAHSIAFDPYNGVTVIFGGYANILGWTYLGDMWTYSYTENSWFKLQLSPSPSARSNHAMVYCNKTNEIILYGGQGPGSQNPTDTWSFSCETQTWSQVVTATSPGVHHSLALAYDSRANAVILFGGFGEDGMEQDDTWKFDCSTREWTEVTTTSAPLARYGHVMVYDESIGKVVMTAGNTMSQGHQHDTWVFDTAAGNWTQLTPIGTPDRLKWPSMVYDPLNQKCILFGGQIGDYGVNRTWIYDGLTNTWTRFYPVVAPYSRINTGLAFDSINNLVILFGGATAEIETFDDTWTYSYADNLWTEMGVDSGSTDGFDPMLLFIASSLIIGVLIVTVVIYRRR